MRESIWFQSFTADDRLIQLWRTGISRYKIIEVHKQTLKPINTLHESNSSGDIMSYWDQLTK